MRKRIVLRIIQALEDGSGINPREDLNMIGLSRLLFDDIITSSKCIFATRRTNWHPDWYRDVDYFLLIADVLQAKT